MATSRNELMAIVGIYRLKFLQMEQRGLLPPPDIDGKYYSDSQVQKCKKWADQNRLYTLPKIAEINHISRATLGKLITQEKIDKPAVRISHTDFYCAWQLPIVKKQIAATPPATPPDKAEERRQLGYFSQLDVAKMAGVAAITFTHHLRRRHAAAGNTPESCRAHCLAGMHRPAFHHGRARFPEPRSNSGYKSSRIPSYKVSNRCIYCVVNIGNIV